jgi:hypothetical protein
MGTLDAASICRRNVRRLRQELVFFFVEYIVYCSGIICYITVLPLLPNNIDSTRCSIIAPLHDKTKDYDLPTPYQVSG